MRIEPLKFPVTLFPDGICGRECLATCECFEGDSILCTCHQRYYQNWYWILYMRQGQDEEYVLVCVLYMRQGQSEEYVIVCILYMR
jgi:hypothetical protein